MESVYQVKTSLLANAVTSAVNWQPVIESMCPGDQHVLA